MHTHTHTRDACTLPTIALQMKRAQANNEESRSYARGGTFPPCRRPKPQESFILATAAYANLPYGKSVSNWMGGQFSRVHSVRDASFDFAHFPIRGLHRLLTIRPRLRASRALRCTHTHTVWQTGFFFVGFRDRTRWRSSTRTKATPKSARRLSRSPASYS